MNSSRKNLINGVLLGTTIAVLLQLGGYFLVRGNRTEFGLAMFVAVPFASGFAVAAVVRRPRRTLACLVMGGLITFSVLLFSGAEGIVCCVMVSPLVAVGVTTGALVGYVVRGRWIDRLNQPGIATLLTVLLAPFFIAAADRVERPFRAIEQHEVFATETFIPAPPERTWDLVAEMRHLDGPRPFLLRVGLPVPTRCEVSQAAVGGRRVCYFDSGQINQEITVWNRPSTMTIRVTDSTLPGRHWLSFIEAGYELTAAGAQTKVVRRTTIGSRLYPRWYWRPLERWGVTSEHDFVFSNLRRWAEGLEKE